MNQSSRGAIIQNTLIPHTAFTSAMGVLETCFKFSKENSDPICVPVIGETRTGKSRLLEEFHARHQSSRLPEGREVPILCVSTPAKPTVKGLVEIMLSTLGDEMADKGTEQSRTSRLKTLIKATGVRIILIDEFQHFFDKGTRKVMYHVADWLKVLADTAKVNLVMAGLPTCEYILHQNEQLKGRCISPVTMPRFDWLNDDHREEFVAILGAFEEALGAGFSLPAFTNDEMSFRIYCGTGGLIGYLTKFLRMVEMNAVIAESSTITLADLQRAHNMAVWHKEAWVGLPSPFAPCFAVNADIGTLETVSKIGTVPEEVVGAPRGSHGRKSVVNILSAR